MADTTSARSSFNPTWLGVALSLVVAILGVGAQWKTVTNLEERVKALEGWKSSQDVAFTVLQSDVGYIKDTLRDIRSILSPSQPQVVLPPGYGYPAQQVPQQPSRRAGPSSPRRSTPRRSSRTYMRGGAARRLRQR